LAAVLVAGWLATTFTEHKDGFDARGLETGFGVSL
jgi:hypothetical protein